MIGNPQFWLPPDEAALNDSEQGAYGATSGYAAKFRSAHTWKRLLKGDLTLASVAGIARELAKRGATRARLALQRGVAVLSGREQQAGELVVQLTKLRSRGCETMLVMSDGDPARETLAMLLPGRDYAVVEGLMRIAMMEGADHAFLMPRTRNEFFALMCGFLGFDKAAPAKGRDRIAA